MSSPSSAKLYENATTSKRILTPEQTRERREVALRGALQGSVLGLSLGAAGVLVAHRVHPGFRALAPSIKAMIVGSSTLAGAVGQAENASLALERRQFGYADESHLNAITHKTGGREISMKDSVIEWINERRWGILGGTWAVAMAGSLAYSFSNRYLSAQQKIVQARMYAQAVTIAALMFTAGISVAAGDDGKKPKAEDARLRQALGLPATPTNTHH